jgi:hypothetical protein
MASRIPNIRFERFRVWNCHKEVATDDSPGGESKSQPLTRRCRARIRTSEQPGQTENS